MLVSIIIPMRNAEEYIKETLCSIFSSEYNNIEVIIVDDGSTDGSVDVVHNFSDSRIKIIPGDCKGISAAFNKALESVTGDIVMRCDADDLYTKDRISKQVTWLIEHPEYDGMCNNFSMIDIKGRIVNDSLNSSSISEDITGELNLGKTRTHFCTYAVKTKVLREIKGCRKYFVTAEDIDLQLRIGEKAKIWYENSVNYLYRLHDASITHSQQDEERIFYEKTARDFLKQRLLNGKDDLEKGIAALPPSNKIDKPKSANEHITIMLQASAWELHRQGKKQQALSRAFKALALNPLKYQTWKAILVILIK